MTDSLNEVWRRWTWNLLCQVPMIADGHVIGSMKALHVSNHLRNYTTQTITDWDDSRDQTLMASRAADSRGFHRAFFF